jgi:seryl-tRNA synthetase
MHDIRLIRADAAAFDAALVRRGVAAMSPEIISTDEARRQAMTAEQTLAAEKKKLSEAFGKAKRTGENTDALTARLEEVAAQIAASEGEAAQADAALKSILESLPNILDASVPDGVDESANVVVKTWGEPMALGFAAKQHFELGEAGGLMEFERAGKIAGSRFTLLRGNIARLNRALGQFMIDLHAGEHGYQEVEVPLLVNAATMYGTGQLPKFEEDLFKTTDGRYLIPTAEVPLTNYVRDEITALAQLPIRFAALSQCFRSEAGSAGRDTRGMLRQHQFPKVELVSITTPDESEAEHERMTSCAEKVLELLELPYRRMLLCAGDTGFGSTKTFDLEVWLPGQQAYREISSCSNMKDFQARRMNARYRGADGKVAGFVHSLNGSGVAVGRAMIAVMENHQQADGSIRIPAALRPYLGGAEILPLA